MVTLMARPIEAPAPPSAGLTIVRASELQVQGNQRFRQEDYISAIDCYSKALSALSLAGEADASLCREMRLAALLSRAACLLHNERRERDLGQGFSNKAIEDCDLLVLVLAERGAVHCQQCGFS